MIKITTQYDDNSSLDFLATECAYEVVLSEIGGAVQSALCNGKDAGKDVRDIIDRDKLLADKHDPFPTIIASIYNISSKIPKVGF